MEMALHLKKATMGIDDLGVSLFLQLVAFLVFGEDQEAHAQHDAFTATTIGRISYGHGILSNFRGASDRLDCTSRQVGADFWFRYSLGMQRRKSFDMIDF